MPTSGRLISMGTNEGLLDPCGSKSVGPLQGYLVFLAWNLVYPTVKHVFWVLLVKTNFRVFNHWLMAEVILFTIWKADFQNCNVNKIANWYKMHLYPLTNLTLTIEVSIRVRILDLDRIETCIKLYVNFNYIHLIKWVRPLNFNPLISCWVHVKFPGRVKNC